MVDRYIGVATLILTDPDHQSDDTEGGNVKTTARERGEAVTAEPNID